MSSPGVASLLTNVQISKMINYIYEFIHDNGTSLRVPLDGLKQLPFVCTKSVQFQPNGEVHRQKGGVALGSPLRPLFVYIMSKVEKNVPFSMVSHCTVCKRNVDVMLSVLWEHADISYVLRTLKNNHSNVRFTLETETDHGTS